MRSLKSLTNPPSKVKKALEAVMLLYTEKDYSSDWKGLLKVMVDPQFLKEVLTLNVETKKKSTIKTVREKYLNTPEWNIEDITKAFEPAGLLAMFIQSQLEKGEICIKIEPLTNEIKELEKGANEAEDQKIKNEDELKEI